MYLPVFHSAQNDRGKSILWLLTQQKLTAGFRARESGVGECSYGEEGKRRQDEFLGSFLIFPLHGLFVLCFMFFSVHQIVCYTITTNFLLSLIRHPSLASTPTSLSILDTIL